MKDRLLESLDAAFHDVLHGRYGGGVSARITQGDRALSTHILRPIPMGLSDHVMLDLGLRGAEPPAYRGELGSVPVGTVTLQAPPDRGCGDIDVITEIFDAHDPNEVSDAGSLSTGILFAAPAAAVAGQMPGGGIQVTRSGETIDARDLVSRQGQRGWLPLRTRGPVNRSRGLGSNGHRRASVTSTSFPISRALLMRVGNAIVAVDGLGSAIQRVVVGLHPGDTGLQR